MDKWITDCVKKIHGKVYRLQEAWKQGLAVECVA